MRCSIFLIVGWLLSFYLQAQPKKGISKIAPHQAKLQVAGNIGLLSAGFGYASRNGKWETDFYYGFVPPMNTGKSIHSVTGKLKLNLISRPIKNGDITFLSTGILLNYSFGKQYFLFTPPNHPYKYYNFPTAAYLGMFFGGHVNHKRIGIYYELVTTDREFSSFLGNLNSIGLSEIWSLGIGLKFQLKRLPGKSVK